MYVAAKAKTKPVRFKKDPLTEVFFFWLIFTPLLVSSTDMVHLFDDRFAVDYSSDLRPGQWQPELRLVFLEPPGYRLLVQW